MESPAGGAVVLVPFPYADLSQAKLRPAVVVANSGREDLILCQVTSDPYADPSAVELTDASFAAGSLQRIGHARPGKLFAAHASLVRVQVGRLRPEVLEDLHARIIALLQQARA